jgi:heat shock protein HslJ
MRCGDVDIEVSAADGDGLRVTFKGESFEMRRARAASGSRYEVGGDASTFLWLRGDRALLGVRGELFPECRSREEAEAMTAFPEPFIARGNEPGWRLELTSERVDLLADYGDLRVRAVAPPTEMTVDGRRYQVGGEHDLSIRVVDELCEDDATGMPYPFRVTIEVDGRTLRGCGGEPRSLFERYEWVVDEIGGESIDPRSRASLVFEEGRLTGTASCNEYTARYLVTGEGLTIEPGALTRRACPQEILEQEDAFLAILREVSRFSLAEDGALILHGNYGRSITAHR